MNSYKFAHKKAPPINGGAFLSMVAVRILCSFLQVHYITGRVSITIN
nr:MAG TPA: hypothetical protein [Caudoviricetes sp.]